ncbi:MAG TPA: N(4)-(beta-N-acetylglucosaminyl)-L-asparaginase [Chitinophagaceae bacterium]|nr:N(4)-(beta-N-acetylglucosaminyl)-L-asparaginase [Chitinophagaceae bacterium]
MMKRRDFVKAIGAAAPLLLLQEDSFSFTVDTSKPLVISTWAPNVKANREAWEVLSKRGSALDAVHNGVMVPEADPEDHSVGLGGLPDRDGNVTLDACIMDHQGNIGAVMGLEHVMHAISVARLVMEKTPHVQLVGQGAFEFAMLQGFKKENLLTADSERAWKEWLKKGSYDPMKTIEDIQERIKNYHDTIGMLAIDVHGNLSGACTTSGMAFKLHGRVGDSSIIGAGLYVDNSVGAASATGVGEDVVRICGSHTIVEAMRYGKSPELACKLALERLISMKGESYAKKTQIGFIAVNKKGQVGCYSMLPDFTMAYHAKSGPQVFKAKSIFNS